MLLFKSRKECPGFRYDFFRRIRGGCFLVVRFSRASLRGRVRDLERHVPGLRGGIGSLRQYVPDLRGGIGGLGRCFPGVREGIGGLGQHVPDLRGRIGCLGWHIPEVRGQIRGLGQQFPGLRGRIGGLGRHVPSRREAIGGLRRYVPDVRERVSVQGDTRYRERRSQCGDCGIYASGKPGFFSRRAARATGGGYFLCGYVSMPLSCRYDTTTPCRLQGANLPPAPVAVRIP